MYVYIFTYTYDVFLSLIYFKYIHFLYDKSFVIVSFSHCNLLWPVCHSDYLYLYVPFEFSICFSPWPAFWHPGLLHVSSYRRSFSWLLLPEHLQTNTKLSRVRLLEMRYRTGQETEHVHFALKADLGSDHAGSSAPEAKSVVVERTDPGEAALGLGRFCVQERGSYTARLDADDATPARRRGPLWFTCLGFSDYLLEIRDSWKKKKKEKKKNEKE